MSVNVGSLCLFYANFTLHVLTFEWRLVHLDRACMQCQVKPQQGHLRDLKTVHILQRKKMLRDTFSWHYYC